MYFGFIFFVFVYACLHMQTLCLCVGTEGVLQMSLHDTAQTADCIVMNKARAE